MDDMPPDLVSRNNDLACNEAARGLACFLPAIASRVPALMLALSLGALTPDIALACSIACPATAAHYRSSEFVFVGTVTKVRKYGFNWFRDVTKVKVYFDIEKHWKGHWDKQPLKTTYDGFSCWGYHFEEGARYIILFNEDDLFRLCDAKPYTTDLEKQIQTEVDRASAPATHKTGESAENL